MTNAEKFRKIFREFATEVWAFPEKDFLTWLNAEYKTIDYRRAFKIACDLLNGDILYGVDTDKIYEIMMQKDDVVSSSSYEEYILNHLQELDKGQYANETDSATRNCFGCKYATDNHNSGTEECHLCMWENQYTPTTKNLGVDCISRDEVCRYVAEFVNHEFSTKEEEELIDNIITGIERMPSVTPQESRWIPVSERLPNLGDYSGSSVWQKKVLITGYLSFDDTKELFVSEAFAEDVMHNSVHDTVVTAWMPLPKPYEPQESEE